MADHIQNVKIKFTSDTEGLKQADKALEGINKEEKEIVENFRKASKEADNFSKEVKDAGNQMSNFNNIGKSVVGTIAGVFAVDKVVDFTKQVISATGQSQKLAAVLANSLGSQSEAQRAITMLTNWAAKTPYDLAQATESYVKLVNQGFKPTEAEMTKLGDLAASTGKSFDQLTEAVIDAQTFEFERLKEFGIRAKKEGDNITFTFKNQETQVAATNEAIRGYILSLGELQGVSGSMAAISETLEGKISNLGDSYDRLLTTIGEKTDTVFTAAIGKVTDFLNLVRRALQDENEVLKEDVLEDINNNAQTTLKRFQEFVAKQGLTGQAARDKIIELQNKALLSAKNTYEQLKEEQEDITDPEVFKIYTEKIILADEKVKALTATFEEFNKVAEKPKKTAEQLEKEFNDRLRILQAEEQFAIRRAKLEERAQSEIIRIQQDYTDQRLNLIKRYGKTGELIYKDNLIKQAELQKEYGDLVKEREKENAEYKAKVHLEAIDKIRFAERDATERMREEGEARGKISRKYANEYAQAMIEAEEKAARQRKEIQEKGYYTFVGITQAIGQVRQNQLQSEMVELEEAREQDLKNVENNEQAKLFYQAKYDREARKIKREMAIADRNNAIFTILLETAKSVMEASPVVPLMVLAGATGAAQLAVASSAPIPKYKKGTKSVPGIDTGDDSVLAMLRPGEAILPTEKNKQYAPAFAAMYDGTVPAPILNRFVLDYQKIKTSFGNDGGSNNDVLIHKLDQLNKSVKNIKSTEISLDEKGFKKYVRTSQSETQFTNNYFRN